MHYMVLWRLTGMVFRCFHRVSLGSSTFSLFYFSINWRTIWTSAATACARTLSGKLDRFNQSKAPIKRFQTPMTWHIRIDATAQQQAFY